MSDWLSARSPGRHLALVGPTASGKSAVAQALAERRIAEGDPVEILSVDSMQVYRGMDVGTAKPTPDDRRRVPHHLLDLADPHEDFSVAQFARAAAAAVEDVEARGGRALLVGGTGLYLQSVVDDLQVPGRFPDVASALAAEPDTDSLHRRLAVLDPVAAARIEPGNRRRVLRALEVTLGSGRRFSEFGPGLAAYPGTPFVLCGLRVPRDVLRRRVDARYVAQIDDGFLDEVRRLTAGGAVLSRTAAQALGYAELAAHLRGELDLDEALELARARTRRFAVRQIRWFRRDPRITWFDHDGDPLTVLDRVDALWRNRVAAGEGSTATVGADRGADAERVD